MKDPRAPFLTTFLTLAALACAPGGQSPAADSRAQADLLIVGGTLVTMDPDRRVIEDGGVAIADGVIVAVDTREAIEAGWRGAETIAGGAHDMVLPGLINGHGHAAMTLLRGVADDLALMDWLQNYIFPAEAATVDPEFVRAGTELAALEMIRAGTTTFADMYYFLDDVAEVTAAAGLRAVLGQSVIDFPVPDFETPAAALEFARGFIERWIDDPRITPALAPHAPYTVSPDILRATAALAREYEVPILIHLAETADEVAQVQERFGLSPTGHLAALGVLGPDVVGAHAIWLSDADIGLLAQFDVGLVHNPESNQKLASGVMRVPEIRAAGIAVGLGTDGAASNNDLDMFGAMLSAPLQQKNVRRDPTATPATEVLAMATIEGARALGMDASIGSLEVGKQGDLVIVDGDAPNLVPRYDAYSHLVYAARGANVRGTIVAGRILFLDGTYRTLDPARILATAREQQARIRAAIQR